MRKVFWVLAIVALLLGGVYFYYMNKVTNRLDQMAAMAGPLVDLEYEDVSLGLGGELRINGLHMRSPNMPFALNARQLALQAGNLYALWSLRRRLESGEMPRSLGLALRGAEVPMNAMSAQGGSVGTGLMFDAAGCGQRGEFDTVDLRAMGFGDLLVDSELEFEMGEYAQTLELRAQTHVHGLTQISVNAGIQMGNTVDNLANAAQGFSRARLGSVNFEYNDRGYYRRMLEYCSNETDMSTEDYIAHHLAAWQQRWREAGFKVGESTVAAYRTFLAAPGRLQVELDPGYAPGLTQFSNADPTELLRRFKFKVWVNDGEAMKVAFESLDNGEAVAAESAREGSDPGDAAPVPEPRQRTARAESSSEQSPDAGARRAGRAATAENSRAADTATDQSAAGRTGSGWRRVSPGELSDYVAYKVDLRTDGGNEYLGRIEEVDPDRIHVYVRGRGGFFVIPVSVDSIASVRVRKD